MELLDRLIVTLRASYHYHSLHQLPNKLHINYKLLMHIQPCTASTLSWTGVLNHHSHDAPNLTLIPPANIVPSPNPRSSRRTTVGPHPLPADRVAYLQQASCLVAKKLLGQDKGVRELIYAAPLSGSPTP